MNKRTYTIGLLSLTAVMLFVANLMVPSRSMADFVAKDRDYQAITARQQPGDEVLYVLDSRSGQMAAFNYDPSRRSLVLRAVKPIQDAFAGAIPAR
ncbi:MAG TPA: hypothetical protein VIM11_01685 [Tepidisphaeraceae bacterium]|jgi:hypothetical protein